MSFERVLSIEELHPGRLVRVQAGGLPILLCQIDGKLHAVHDTCLHRGGSLSGGERQGNSIVCPLHFWGFDLQTGICTQVPTMVLRVFPTKIENGEVYIEV